MRLGSARVGLFRPLPPPPSAAPAAPRSLRAVRLAPPSPAATMIIYRDIISRESSRRPGCGRELGAGGLGGGGEAGARALSLGPGAAACARPAREMAGLRTLTGGSLSSFR